MSVKNFSPFKVVKDALVDLKQNEVTVVTGRFGVETEHKTLSAIGKKLDLSRERIRQIEREALKKLAKKIVDENNPFVTEIIESFENHGGIVNHEKIAEKFLDEIYHPDRNEFNALHLIFVLMPQIIKIDKTKELETGWMLATLSKKDAVRVIDDWADHLKKLKKPESIDVLIETFPGHKKHKVAFLSSLPEISKKIVLTDEGKIGLSVWPEVNPKNVRDKIYFVLKKADKPVHFEEIAKQIMAQRFDGKRVVKATVHNELIADTRFVLVGRGIYALSEWGYSEGTVADIIKSVLKDKPAGLKAEEIVKAVLKQRIVKKNTILINLQTKPFFKKVSKDSYALK